MTYTTLSPKSFSPLGCDVSPRGQADAIWRHELDAACRSERRARRAFRLHRLRLRLVG